MKGVLSLSEAYEWDKTPREVAKALTGTRSSLSQMGGCCVVLNRIGGATALFNQGISPEFIKAIGRWWSGAYLLYIRQMQGNAQRVMVQACSQNCEYLENTPDDADPDDEE